MAKDVLLEDLTPQQKEAVLHSGGPVLVLSGAGNGKTSVVTCRFAHLVKKKRLNPSSVFTVTLSNRAAEDMKAKLSSAINCDHKQSWIGTLHTHCDRILRKESKLLGFKTDFIIYDEDDQSALIRHILKEFNIYEALYKGVASRIKMLKSSLMGPEEFLAQGDGFSFDEKLGRVYLRYQDELKRCNSLDHDDLVLTTVRLFEENPKLLQKYHEQFPALLVDEFQDINRSQYKLLKLLSGKKMNICAVGDDDQNAFKPKSAESCNMDTFVKDFPGAKVIKLDQNFRSSGNILRVAGSAIAKNAHTKPKQIKTDCQCGEKVFYCSLSTEEEEAKYVARTIKDLYLKSNYEYNNFAVFYRIPLQAKAVEDALSEEDIPYQVIGGISFYSRKEVKDIISYMRLAVNNNCNVSLRRIINSPPRGIGQTTINKIEQESRKNGASLYKTIKTMLQNGLIATSFKDKLTDFVKTIDKISAASCKSAADLINTINTRTGYLESLDEEKVQFVQLLMRDAEGIAPRDFLDRIALVTANDEAQSITAVSLMPLQNVKGLEFPVVFIVGVEEGVLPYFKAFDNPAEIQEERRLFYVGMTRASKILSMTTVKKRRLYSKIQEQEPSRFLADIPKDCCEWIERAQAQQKEKRTPDKIIIPPVRKAPPFIIGARVKHPSWGIGIVRECCGDGEDAKVTVNFPGVGLKRLAARMANLERI